MEYGEIDGGREDVVKVSVGDIEDRRRTKRTTKGVMSVHRTVEVVGRLDYGVYCLLIYSQGQSNGDVMDGGDN